MEPTAKHAQTWILCLGTLYQDSSVILFSNCREIVGICCQTCFMSTPNTAVRTVVNKMMLLSEGLTPSACVAVVLGVGNVTEIKAKS
jgi:hypothetical protein